MGIDAVGRANKLYITGANDVAINDDEVYFFKPFQSGAMKSSNPFNNDNDYETTMQYDVICNSSRIMNFSIIK